MAKFSGLIFSLSCLLLFCSCGHGHHLMLQDGDLLFQVSESSDFADAIVESTGVAEGISFAHVGIFGLVEGDSVVIEATPGRGVCLTPLNDFLNDSKTIDGSPGVVVMRVKDECAKKSAIANAMTLVGQPYDWEFEPNNGKVYCSELVQLCFKYADGTPIFESIPMNFKDKDGSMPVFWIDLFGGLGKDVPQDKPGTNPNSLSDSPLLYEVKRYF